MKLPRFPWRRKETQSDGGQVVHTDIDLNREESATDSARTLGTFGGVFTPSFLTIIGVIMYLRFGWIVANAGLIQALIIVGIANLITAVTALSVASIASNERMETGGAYFMISRVLGFSAGGSIGIPLYLSQALSISLYTIGFAEALHAVAPGLPVVWIALVTLAALSLLALVGADFMVRVQYVIFAAIIASLVSIFAGAEFVYENLQPQYTGDATFWSVFAIFFPAVTGILAGVSMSGNLKTPEKSIPRGTLLAVAAGFAVYIVVPVVLAFSVPRDGLAASTSLRDASRWPAMVTAGVMGATLSSAIGTLLAAPRTLQALAHDRIAPKVFAIGLGKRNEPLPALALSVGMAFVAILLGDLNVVAGVLTMFFLTTYGVLNFAAAIESAVGNPSFRPSIRVAWPINMAAALGCFAVMFLIQPIFTLTAIVIVGAIFLFLQFNPQNQPGGIWEGFWTALFFKTSEQLKKSRSGSGKNWRPMVQVFASEPKAHSELINTSVALTRRSGALAVFQMVDRDTPEEMPEELVDVLAHRHVSYKRIVTDDFQEGVVVASQAEGFAAGSSNTVIMGLSNNPRGDAANTRMLTNLCDLEKNIVLFHKGHREWTGFRGPIRVWWGGQENNVRLMLVLADILANSDEENEYDIELASIVNESSLHDDAIQRLQATAKDLRIQVTPMVFLNEEERNPVELIAEESRNAALVLLGMARPGPDTEKEYLSRLRDIAERLESAMFVYNNNEDVRYE